MALYDASTINTNTLASVFNKLYSAKAASVIRRKNGLLYAILGKPENGSTPGLESFERLDQSNGNNIEIRVMGKLRTVGTVASNTAALLTITNLTYNADVFGSMTFDYTHFADTLPVPENELLKIKGSEAKTASYVDDLFNHVLLSLEQSIGNQITAQASTTAATWSTGTTSQMCSIFNIISDGTSTWSSTNTNYYQKVTDAYLGASYGSISRSDETNATFRSYVYGGVNQSSAGTGQLTLGKLYTTMNATIANGGSPKIALCDAAVYGYVQALTAAHAQVQYSNDPNNDWNSFGGVYLSAFGMKFILDQRLGNINGSLPGNSCGTLFLIDPTYWRLYRTDQNLTTSGLVRDVSRVATYVMPYSTLTQLVCSNPAAGGAKMIGITG